AGARELRDQRLALGVVEVDADAALVAVEREERRRAPGPGRRRPGARVVAGARAFDLDHVGAEIAEDLRAVRACDVLREVEHAPAREDFLHRGRHAPAPRRNCRCIEYLNRSAGCTERVTSIGLPPRPKYRRTICRPGDPPGSWRKRHSSSVIAATQPMSWRIS